MIGIQQGATTAWRMLTINEPASKHPRRLLAQMRSPGRAISWPRLGGCPPERTARDLATNQMMDTTIGAMLREVYEYMNDRQLYQDLMDAVTKATYNNNWDEANRVGAQFRERGLIAVFRAEDKTVYLLLEDEAEQHLKPGDRILGDNLPSPTEEP